ncbi:MAG: hypothetical protein ACLR4A_09465 [Christensenellales bacterium]
METLTLDVDGDVQSIAPYTEGKLLMIVNNYDADPVTTTLCLYDIENEEATELGALPTQDYSTPSGISYDEARGKLYLCAFRQRLAHGCDRGRPRRTGGVRRYAAELCERQRRGLWRSVCAGRL